MNNAWILPFGSLLVVLSFIGYMSLEAKIPGKGVKNMIENALKDTMTFDQAIKALTDGHRIRRKSERCGYTKVIVIEGKSRKEKYATYFVSDSERISDYCNFKLEEVLATDWIIDD